MPESIWRAPVLRQNEESERRVTWIELFFDLVFVALVSALSANLARQVDAAAVAQSALLFTAMWVIWRFAAIYADRFETDDVSFRLAILGIMAAVAVMAVSAGEGLDNGFRGFAVGYIAADAIISVLWQRGARHNPEFRPLANRLTLAHASSIALWVVALVLGNPIGWWFALAGLAIDLAVPFLSTRQQESLPKLSASHLPERFGLFTIIVLGEAMIVLIAGLSSLHDRSLVAWIAGASVLVLVTGVYWMYFDQIMWDKPPEKPLRRDVTQYLHLPLVMAIALTSAFTREYVEEPLSPFSTSSRLLFVFGVAMALVSIALLDTMLASQPLRACVLGRSRTAEFVGAGALVVLGIFGSVLPGLALVIAADVAVLAVIVVGARELTTSGSCEL